MRLAGLFLMALLYIAAGINHFVNPEFYLRIMPQWVPAHELMVAVSGVAEVVLGALLLPAGTRERAAWGVIALLIAILPANVQMAINWQEQHHPHLWIAWARLPLQLVLIYWAWRYTRR